jgi:hypothetical protein
LRKFDFLRLSFYDESDWTKEQFCDLSGYGFPTKYSERDVLIQVLSFCGIVGMDTKTEDLEDFNLEELLLENNISVTFFDNKE